ncbi:hypothetical protein pdam_00005785 [Pocillopora damicornis]|uniref:Uncharacterized protein n=1 Tax=Pocillopora damicornis TaxID=46731 RepID=A0A3M6UVC6_POCDA|nr:hypothetical protein pdam_00005785 [Pocillopora damicornis]
MAAASLRFIDDFTEVLKRASDTGVQKILVILYRYFEKQFHLAEETKLPMFLHSRSAHQDFIDAPWCDIRPTHAGFKHVKTKFESRKKEKWQAGQCVKGRNEPANIVQVLEVVAGCRGEDVQSLAETVYENTMNLFFR